MRSAVFLILTLVLAAGIRLQAHAQQPTPALMVVQAAGAGAAPATAAPVRAVTAEDSSTLQAALKALRQTKAVNEETLKKQEAMLQQLDELQKAAEQLRIFSKRS